MFSPAFRNLFQSAFAKPDAVAGVTYLLYDDFSVPVAAGSVNGTLSTSPFPTGGGGARTVVDGNNKLSIAGDVASFATGGVGASNPALWYPGQTRVAGFVLLWQVNPTVGIPDVGWDTAQSGALAQFLKFNVSGGSLRYGATLFVGSFVSGTTYQVAIIFRATGIFALIKGGAFTNWNLIWIDSTISTTPVYAGIQAGNSTSVVTADNIRIPDPSVATQKYIVPTLAYDTFTRSNGVLGSTETTSPDGLTIAALAWQFTASIWAIASNKAVATPTLGADVITNGDFAVDANWSKGVNWTISGGLAHATAANGTIFQQFTVLSVANWYQTTYTILNYSAGIVFIRNGSGTSFNGVARTANGTYTETRRAGATAAAFQTQGVTTLDIDNVSVKPLTLAELISEVTVSTPDVIAEVSPTWTVGYQAGLVLNLDSQTNPLNFVACYLTNNNGVNAVRFEKYVAGVCTELINTAVTYVAGAPLRASKRGTEYRVFYNDLAVSTVQTISDAGIISNAKHGLFSTSPLNQLDNFELWASGTANEHAILDTF